MRRQQLNPFLMTPFLCLTFLLPIQIISFSPITLYQRRHVALPPGKIPKSSSHSNSRLLQSPRPPEEGERLYTSEPILLEKDITNLKPDIIVSDEVIDDKETHKLGIWAARGILLLVAMLWGTNFASVKYLETLCFHPPCHHIPSEAALARFGVAACVSIPLLIGQRKDIILAGLECGLWITIGYITQAMALSTISSGKCAFICSLTVVVVPLLSAFFGRPIRPINIVSALIALTGVGVLEGLIDVTSLTSFLTGSQPALAESMVSLQPLSSVTSTSTTTMQSLDNPDFLVSIANSMGVTKGDILALGQPLGFGFSFMRIEHYVEKFKDVENRIITITAAECVLVGVFSLFWVLYDFHGTLPNFGYMVRFQMLYKISFEKAQSYFVS
jgi:drug/metabolite transporter (DMT)-like permease